LPQPLGGQSIALRERHGRRAALDSLQQCPVIVGQVGSGQRAIETGA
jgi:hypothetical protein